MFDVPENMFRTKFTLLKDLKLLKFTEYFVSVPETTKTH